MTTDELKRMLYLLYRVMVDYDMILIMDDNVKDGRETLDNFYDVTGVMDCCQMWIESGELKRGEK